VSFAESFSVLRQLFKLFIFLFSVLVSSEAISDDISLQSREEITIVAPDFWCPFSCEVGKGKEGFTIDILRAIFRPLGKSIRFENLNYSRALLEVRNGKYNATPATFKNEAPDFIYPELPISRNRYCFYTNINHTNWEYAGVTSLAGHSIGIVQSYSYGTLIDNAIKTKSAVFEVHSGSDLTYRMAKKVMLNRLEIFVEDENLVNYTMHAKPDIQLKEAGCESPTYAYFALSPKRGESQMLAAEFDQGMKRLHLSGELGKILSAYGLRDWMR
jgi:polar amino acid transport system substrate-binding protein